MARGKNNAKSGKRSGRGSAGQNRSESTAYLEKNRRKEGVKVTASGLQYTVREKGSGSHPDEFSTVHVHQRIMLVDGTVIADTYKRGDCDIFTIAEAIDGLKEGLPLMTVGGRYRFVVPSALAWGKRGAGDRIGPYAALIFDIRLEKIC